uniref:Acidic fibroblast growth factor intracellular-binding protein n=1 Tax=Trichuris muris TaxID=70415 RepID=A0A5S6Q9J8_TRIMR
MTGLWDLFFVGSVCYVDVTIVSSWVAGHDVSTASAALLKNSVLKEFEEADEACVLSEVNDHYRMLNMLEKFLENPARLLQMRPFLLDTAAINLIIQKYYEIDDSVIREICGKRPTGKLRREAEEISEKTGIAVASCRRQLDNYRRVYRFVEDLKGSLLLNISKHFLLPAPLAQKYATAVFLACYRFELNKKRLDYLSFEDLVACSVQMINHWSSGSLERGSEEDLSIDREFLHELKDVRLLNDRDNISKFRIIVLKSLKGKLSTTAYEGIKENFKTMFKSVVDIAIDLNHTRDFRDFFLDLTENVIVPCRLTKWKREDLLSFFEEIKHVVKDYCNTKLSNAEMALNWERYMQVLTACALQMYRSC